MKRKLGRFALVGLAVAVAPAASAQLHTPVYPTWTALVSPDLAKAKNLPEPSSELKACFDVHQAALAKKPEAVFPLVADYIGPDPVRRDCAMAAEVEMMATRWRVSSPMNNYSPLISSFSKQNGSLAKRSEMERRQGRQFIFDSAVAFNAMLGGMIPNHVYLWMQPAAGAPCAAASQ